MKTKVLFILGPTAVGKTAVSVEIAKLFNGEIISCDSVQIFKGLDIGSAKVTEEEKQNIPHHLIDIKEPTETFTSFQFVEEMKKKIKEITERGKLPIVVGGTSLYVKSLILNYNFGGVGVDEEFRAKLNRLLEEKGLESLYSKLSYENKELAEKIDRFNPQRVIRALEISHFQGEKKSAESEIDSLVFALTDDRKNLYERINRRVDIMLKNGLVEEVQDLKNAGVSRECQSMKAIGYKEVYAYLDGEITYEKMVEEIKQHSRNYAKRQFTFLRGMENINYIQVENFNDTIKEISEKVKKWLK
mgnify:FL=1